MLGCSNSAYCIGDNFDVIHSLFPQDSPLPSTSAERIEFLRELLTRARKAHNLKFFGDIVIPQVGVDSALVKSNPDACYSLHACPYLKPAFVLDIGIRVFFEPISGKLTSEAAVDSFVDEFRTTTYQGLKLWEYYAFDVARELSRFDEINSGKIDVTHCVIDDVTGKNVPSEKISLSKKSPAEIAELILKTSKINPQWPRWPRYVDPQVVAAFAGDRERFRRALDDANVQLYAEYDDDTAAVMDHLRGGLKYEFLAPGGGHSVPRYFCLISPESAYTVDVLGPLDNIVAIANHGWVMNGSADIDYAGPGSKAYIRRELVPWCDTAKLRYGSKREDNPALWDYMTRYVRLMAGIFDGFRIDNCHSIPIHILRYLLAQARSVNPKLLVFAELFSSMEHKLEYVATCGLDALVREIGKASGSFEEYISALSDTCGGWYSGVPAAPQQLPQHDGAYIPAQAPVIDWAYDQTHDNQPLSELRGSQDVNALTAALAMCKTPVGSMRGVDELYQHEVNVVHERRRFDPFIYETSGKTKAGGITIPGIMSARKVYNKLHHDLDKEGYDSVRIERIPYGNHIPGLIFTRINPKTLDKVVMLTLDALHEPYEYAPLNGWFIDIYGSFVETLFFSSVKVSNTEASNAKAAQFLTGVTSELTLLESPDAAQLSPYVSVYPKEDSPDFTRLAVHKFPAGSVVCFKFTLPAHAKAAWARASELISGDAAARSLDGVSLLDMNVLMYRCPSEERDDRPDDVYGIPGYGDLVYHGLQGWMDALFYALKTPVVSADNPVVRNVSDGLWAIKNMISRIEHIEGLKKVRENYLKPLYEILEALPVSLRFRAFADAVKLLYDEAVKKCVDMMSPFVKEGSTFVKELAMGSVMFYGRVAKAPLVDPKLLPESIGDKFVPSLAAGFDHFSVGYMRSWGRDTTIALPGLLFTTGRFE